MDSQITAIALNVGLTISKLTPSLPYLTPEVRKQLVNTKIKAIATVFSYTWVNLKPLSIKPQVW